MKWLISAAAFVCVALTGCTHSGDDVQFAKTTITRISNADMTVESDIDFDHLQGMSMDIGAIYSKLPTDTEKSRYRSSFITDFSKSFHSSGATVEGLTNWRIQKSTPPTVEVAVDGPRNTIYLTVSHPDGVQKLSGISLTPSP